MQLTWRDSLLVGIPEVDDQHREFVARINALLWACNEGQGAEKLQETGEFLADYVELHFSAEEALMQVKGYPKRDAHVALHAWFRSEYEKLRALLAKPEQASTLSLQLNQLLVRWFTNHISTEDRAFAEYLEDQG